MYFLFEGKYYEQLEGAAMGSSIHPIASNLSMENVEFKALSTLPYTLSLWKRCVDDTFVVIKTVHKIGLLEHVNSIDQCIQFTEETTRADGSMTFLETLVIPQPDGSLETTVHRKPNYTDQYIH